MWFYEGKEFLKIPEGIVGFVYLITNLIDDRKYIGKKIAQFSRIKKIKGRRRRIKKESDWVKYWSSSELLKSDIKKYGEENFKREILHLCTNKMELNYLELKEQIDRRVLESNDYYNELLYCRIRKCKYLLGGKNITSPSS
jgi:hypothetical protein